MLLAPDAGEGVHPGESRTRPAPGAVRLLDLLSGPPGVLELARRLLADAWVVERLEDLPADFAGIAATRGGRVWFGSYGELRQLTRAEASGCSRAATSATGWSPPRSARRRARPARAAACERALEQLRAAEAASAEADEQLRDAERRLTEAAEAARRSEWLIEQRRAAPAQGPLAVRRAELEGELAAERRQSERLEQERVRRRARMERLQAQQEADGAALPRAEHLARALGSLVGALEDRVEVLESGLAGDRQAGRADGRRAARVRGARGRDPSGAARGRRDGDGGRGGRAARARASRRG